MKKILTIVLTLAMIACMSINAFAAEVPNSSKEGEIPVTGFSYSTYEFSIPANVHFEKDVATPFKIHIVSCNKLDSETLVFVLDNINDNDGITLNHTTKEDVTANVSLYLDNKLTMKITKTSNDMALTNTGYGLTVYGVLDSNATAGEYTGIINFRFYLTD